MSSHATREGTNEPPEAPHLIAAGKTLDRSANRLAPLVATPSGTPMDALRAQCESQGYLWLKGFFDPRSVNAFRARVFDYLAPSGLIAPGSDPQTGLAGPDPVDKAAADRRLMAFVRSAAFEAFCSQPAIVDFMDRFLGGLTYLHKRKIMRFTRPGSDTATPAHYDLVYLRGGTDRIVTAWIPIGDVPSAMGGLVYLEGSHAIGTRMEADFAAKARDLSPRERISAFNRNMTAGGWVSRDLPAMAEQFDTRWLYADYEAGDLLLHSPYMIHAATTNRDPGGRIRLSTDLRYQNVEDEIDARWANHWSLDDML